MKNKLSRRTLNGALNILTKMGIFNAFRNANPSALTVLNYHRVNDVARPGFDTFAPNVSATPADFAMQMDYLKRHYNVISCEYLSAWLRGEKTLPPHSAIITFDDGYYDNLAYAYPILKARSLPAVIFLTTDYIGRNKPFYWDYVAYCFHHSRKSAAQLPVLGAVSWLGEAEMKAVIVHWIQALKRLSDDERQEAIANLANILDVVVPQDAFSGLYLTWDQVREMSRNGIEMGSHTVHHPILTRIPLTSVEDELIQSKRRIEAEIGKLVIGFAYPNGGLADFSTNVVNAVRQTGFEVAFTLVEGTTSYKDVRSNPLTIHRIFLATSDVFPRFVAKLSGTSFLFEQLSRFTNSK